VRKHPNGVWKLGVGQPSYWTKLEFVVNVNMRKMQGLTRGFLNDILAITCPKLKASISLLNINHYKYFSTPLITDLRCQCQCQCQFKFRSSRENLRFSLGHQHSHGHGLALALFFNKLKNIGLHFGISLA
jgi:hypothetical protein